MICNVVCNQVLFSGKILNTPVSIKIAPNAFNSISHLQFELGCDFVLFSSFLAISQGQSPTLKSRTSKYQGYLSGMMAKDMIIITILKMTVNLSKCVFFIVFDFDVHVVG